MTTRLLNIGIAIVVSIAAALTVWRATARIVDGERSNPPRVTAIADWTRYSEAGIREGPEQADVTIVVFADFQCPACRDFDRILTALRRDHPDEVATVFRHLPLRYHPMAFSAAMAAECAAVQGFFEPFRELVFQLQDSLAYVGWSTLATRAGVSDVSAFRECIAEEHPRQRIREDIESARDLGVRSTPGVLVNDQLYFGMPTVEEIAEVIHRGAARDPS